MSATEEKEKLIGSTESVGASPTYRSVPEQNGKLESDNGFPKDDVALDFPNGMTLTWNKICCYAPDIHNPKNKGQQYKQILFDVCGLARPGDLLAILGASGAGKSTLMNIFTSRNLGQLRVTGTVKVNGQELGADIKRVSAYVQQDDAFWGQLTVREHLWVQALLRMGRHVSAERRRQRVAEVIRDMGLDECADDLISVPKKGIGISGSEQKLLAFASELLTDPPIMLCDEPTSGLDSLMAESVVLALRDLTRRGKTVVCTIHQPSSNIYALFGRVQLMAEGRLAYLGSRQETREFFRTCGFPCPVNYNPADHYIHGLAIRPGEESMCRTKVAFLCDKYARSQKCAENQAEIERWESVEPGQGQGAAWREESDVMRESVYKASWWTQLKTITWRHWILTVRNPALFSMRILQIVIYCLTIIFIYQNPEMNQAAVRNLNGAMFEIIIAVTFFSLTQLNSFTSELALFYRDHHNALYRTDVYFIAKNLVDIPLFVVIILIAIVPPYWIIGFYKDFVTFLISLGTFALVYQFSISLNVYLIGIATGRVDIALNIAPIIRVVFMLLGGFFVNDSTVPVWLSWLQYLSWHHYSFEILLIYQWRGIKVIDCSDAVNGTVSTSCYKNGQDVIDFYRFNESNIAFDFIMLVVLGLVFRVLAFCALYLKSRQQKKTAK